MDSPPLADCHSFVVCNIGAARCAAWVGYTDPLSVVRPVIGADVRWEIDQQYAARVGSMQFRTSDDNRNSGGGAATGVQVHDALTSGVLANYTVISVAPGTLNLLGGYDLAVGGLAAGATSNVLLSVKGSTDGVYCDTATLTAAVGSIGMGSDTACLTVATPHLTITKVNAPKVNVIPGYSYTSTIVVANDGHATATGVVIADTLGLAPVTNVRVTNVSSSQGGVAGVLLGNSVSGATLDIPQATRVTFTIVSRIPLTATRVMMPNTALYAVHVVNAPIGTPAPKLYTTSYIWSSVSADAAMKPFQASSSEPTTVIP